jgi:Fe-S-cluster containining protein
MKQAMLIDKDTLKFEHVKRLALFIIEHEKTCEKCLFFSERGSKVRCAEYLNMDKVCSKWQKRVEGKV